MKLSIVLMFAAMPVLAGTRIWTGVAGGTWSNPANWDGGVPLQGDDLVFPSGASASTNDLPAVTLHSISYFAEAAGITGNAIVLGSGGLTVANRFIVSILQVHIDAPVALAASQTWTFTPPSMSARFTEIDLAGNALALDVQSLIGVSITSIIGTGAIVKRGSGPLFLTSAFSAPMTIEGGTVQLQEATTGDLTIGSGATLLVRPGVHQFTPATARSALFEPGSHFSSENGAWLDATGAVALNNATLDIFGTPGSPWLIIKNDGTDPVSGRFLGLAEGAIVNENFDSYRISYFGGDGNDVTLTRLAVPAASTSTTVSATVFSHSATLTATVSAGATGSVGFYDSGVLLGTVALDSAGRASLTTPLSSGQHEITAAYSGSDGFATSRGTIDVTVPRSRAARH